MSSMEDVWIFSGIAHFSSFALHQKKVRYILGQWLTKILLLFREYLILIMFYFASSDYNQMVISREHEKMD